jgi:hypothetical protein
MESASEQTYVGLDVHRKSVTATVFNAAGSRVSQERFGATDAVSTAPVIWPVSAPKNWPLVHKA